MTGDYRAILDTGRQSVFTLASLPEHQYLFLPLLLPLQYRITQLHLSHDRRHRGDYPVLYLTTHMLFMLIIMVIPRLILAEFVLASFFAAFSTFQMLKFRMAFFSACS